jgi:hypothetical protein
MKMHEEIDPALQALFDDSHARMREEPFVSATMARVAASHARAAIVKGLLQALALLAVVWFSPLLIEASVRLSALLDDLFAAASQWLATPAGMLVALLCAVVALVLKRRLIF